MTLFLWLIGLLFLLAALYLWLIAPAREAPDTSGMDGWLYAHRGLHDETAPENSLAAFGRAVEKGYGMELDVQLTRDGQLVVFHDASLKRVCGVDALVREMTYEELCAWPLPDGSRIPLFSETLALVDGKAPMIVEVKYYGDPVRNAEKVLKMLQSYEGAYAVESFHPLAVRYFRQNAPEMIRGQLARGGAWDRKETSRATHLAMKYLLMNVVGRPHFVAYSCEEDHNLGMWIVKRLYRPPLAAWTIRDPGTLKRAQEDYQWAIFEGFLPDAHPNED